MKNRYVLSVLVVLVSMLQLKAQYQTVPLTGFNHDVVANIAGNALGSSTIAYDQSDYVFMSDTYNPSGTHLPATGLVNSAVASTPGLTFQLAPYTANNDLRLTSNQTGTLTFVTPTQTKDLYILGSTGQGFSNANITVTFTDNTTQSFSTINFQDWFNGSDYAIKGMGRVVRSTNAISNDTNNPRIYQVKLSLLQANYYKFIQSVSFTNIVTTTAVLNIMAMTITPPPTLYPYDPSVTFISKPLGSCFTATQILSARLKNFGANPINLATNPITVTLYAIGPNGTETHSKTVNTGTLNALAVDSINVVFNGLNTFNFFPGGTYYINSTLTVSGLTNGLLSNDSISPGNVLINYRPTPGPDYHLCKGSSVPFGQGLTVQGCSTPLLDSATITFTIGSGCIDNTGASGTGGSVGPPANCDNQYSCSFASGILPALPTGAFFTSPGTLTVTNLALNPSVSTFYANANQVRFNLYGASPVPPDLYSAGAQGANGTFPFTYSRPVASADLAAIYSSLAPGSTLHMGYWENWNDNATLSDIITNNGGTSVATLKFYYYYYLPSFEWYDALSGGSVLYNLSPFNPLSVTNALVNNSNTEGTYTFYVACSGTSVCRSPVNFVVDSIPSSFPASIAACEDLSGSNQAIVDLTTLTNTISGGASGVTVGYFYDPGFFTPIAVPSLDTTGSTLVYSKVTKQSTGCYVGDSVYVTIHPTPEILPDPMFGLTCNCLDVVSLINPFSYIPSGSDTSYYENSACTIAHPNPHLICTADSVYVVVTTNTSPSCSDTVSASIDLSPGSFQIANQTNSNTSSCNSIPIVNNFMTDGATELFYNPIDCKKLAIVTDAPNSISMGTTSVEEVIDCSIPTYNGQPYLNRMYHITPNVQDSATVCLFYLQSDIDEFNIMSQSILWPELDPFTLDSLTISQTHNGDFNTPGHTVTVIPTTAITKSYDPVNTIWTVCFHVDSFSYFYGHTPNPLNAALPITLNDFNAIKEKNTARVLWSTSSERNNAYFDVERSRNGKEYYSISSHIESKAEHGNSSLPLSYSFLDEHPQSGHNFYRLKQVDRDGKITYSTSVDLLFGDQTPVRVFPNPAQDKLTIEIQANKTIDVQIQLTDATGRVVLNSGDLMSSGLNTIQLPVQQLQPGVYFIHVKNNSGMNVVQEIIKQ